MKKKFTKPSHFKIRKSDPDDGICTCITEGIMSPHCLEIGICPSLHIVGVYQGVGKKMSLSMDGLKNK